MNNPLLSAIVTKNIPQFEELINNPNINVNVCNIHQTTPLMCAVYHESIAMTRVLIERGADVEAQDQSGKTALRIITDNESQTNNKNIKTVLSNILIKNTKNFYYQYFNVKTTLMKASKFGPELVETLLDAGANPNIQDQNGETALMKAIKKGHIKSVYILANAARTKLFIDRCDGMTALLMAAYMHSYEMVKLLLDAGSDANESNKQEFKTALMYACDDYYGVNTPEAQVKKVALLLIKYGALVNRHDKYGQTAEYYATKNHYYEVAAMIRMNNIIPRKLQSITEEEWLDVFQEDNKDNWSVVDKHMNAEMEINSDDF